MSLQHLEKMATSAHRNTSFDPEKRGAQMVKDYGEELAGDLAELEAANISAESRADYKARYERYFSSWLGAKGRTFSVMITGPGNFPLRRHAKANRSEQRHYEVFREWRIRAKKAIIRKAKPKKTFSGEIERYRAQLESMRASHQLMKACNAIIRKAKGGDCTADLVAAGLSEGNAKQIQQPDYAGRIGFASFNLTNNNANMKRVEGRIKELEAKDLMSTTGQQEFIFEGFRVVYNHAADRLQVIHDHKPAADVIAGFKGAGFRWSPSAGAWQRLMNNGGISAAIRLLKINLPYL